MTTRKIAFALATGTLALAACSKKAPEQLPPAPQQQGTTTPTPTTTAPNNGPGTQQHFLQTVGQTNTVIYFGLDQYNVDAEDQRILQTQAQYFSQYPNVTFTIEGHADERGTREYNLALGERRANAAKNYLVSVGIPANRIRTISYGKERPVAMGSNEQAWAQNRRAATVVIN
ncbi:peptidoglycan-associated lipoprotein Pal [Qipengyuania spongiae]|uniref:Peptidoglycan-associated lipoprotein n=1 Tax=Qipengyuania spongiae TaxID=2909673 RepID=A0ABY5T1E8_9SPHN|nr:peptidoglycan-associated lipoprotein Pal [Qipengyuania spongiae]UVI40620.1 peptidoglycan-associated lipoprotein Pal [Qipengyuania spongiae]